MMLAPPSLQANGQSLSNTGRTLHLRRASWVGPPSAKLTPDRLSRSWKWNSHWRVAMIPLVIEGASGPLKGAPPLAPAHFHPAGVVTLARRAIGWNPSVGNRYPRKGAYRAGIAYERKVKQWLKEQ